MTKKITITSTKKGLDMAVEGLTQIEILGMLRYFEKYVLETMYKTTGKKLDKTNMDSVAQSMADALKLCEDCIPNRESILGETIENALEQWNKLNKTT